MNRPYLCLAMRHLKLEQYPLLHGNVVGESLMTLTHSNRSWPRDVSYQEMMKARQTVIQLRF